MELGTVFTEEQYDEAYEFVSENGYTIEEIEPKDNVRQFKIVAIPEPLPPTYEEVDAMRVAYRQAKIDDKTIARMRKQANETWTEEDEKAYLALDAEVTAYIEENYPYPK